MKGLKLNYIPGFGVAMVIIHKLDSKHDLLHLYTNVSLEAWPCWKPPCNPNRIAVDNHKINKSGIDRTLTINNMVHDLYIALHTNVIVLPFGNYDKKCLIRFRTGHLFERRPISGAATVHLIVSP